MARRVHRLSTLRSCLLPNLIAAYVPLGDLTAARAAADEGWPHARELDAAAWWADHPAMLAARERRPRTAARWLGLADAGYLRLNDARETLEAQAAVAVESAVRAALSEGEFAALRAEGGWPAAAELVFAAALADEDCGPPLSRRLGSAPPP